MAADKELSPEIPKAETTTAEGIKKDVEFVKGGLWILGNVITGGRLGEWEKSRKEKEKVRKQEEIAMETRKKMRIEKANNFLKSWFNDGIDSKLIEKRKIYTDAQLTEFASKSLKEINNNLQREQETKLAQNGDFFSGNGNPFQGPAYEFISGLKNPEDANKKFVESGSDLTKNPEYLKFLRLCIARQRMKTLEEEQGEISFKELETYLLEKEIWGMQIQLQNGTRVDYESLLLRGIMRFIKNIYSGKTTPTYEEQSGALYFLGIIKPVSQDNQTTASPINKYESYRKLFPSEKIEKMKNEIFGDWQIPTFQKENTDSGEQLSLDDKRKAVLEKHPKNMTTFLMERMKNNGWKITFDELKTYAYPDVLNKELGEYSKLGVMNENNSYQGEITSQNISVLGLFLDDIITRYLKYYTGKNPLIYDSWFEEGPMKRLHNALNYLRTTREKQQTFDIVELNRILQSTTTSQSPKNT